MLGPALKRSFLLAVILAALVFGGLLTYALQLTETPDIGNNAGNGVGNSVAGNAATANNDAAPQSLVDAGRYVAVAADCAACHTTPDGKPFAGGLPLASPIGNIYSTNITPDKASGIGRYSLKDFDRAIRYGITPEGGTLYPAMPYPSYARMTDQDVRALYAYFMHEVAPVASANRSSDIHWPLSIRWPLAIWRKMYAPATAVVPVNLAKYPDPIVARGAYLVQSLGHCGSCHTPRAVTLQELSLDESQLTYLSGGPEIDGWVAVNLRGNDGAGLGRMSAPEIADLLRSARNTKSAVIGAPMADVVTHSMQNMTEADLQAMAAYLKTLPASVDNSTHYVPNSDTANALKAGKESGRGAQLYVDTCAACHRSNGEGSAKVFPSIAGNPTVLAGNPVSLIRLVLAGSELPSTKTAPSNLGMPGFAWRLSDSEAAQLVNFIRQSWGNSAPATSAEEVAKVRKTLVVAENNAS